MKKTLVLLVLLFLFIVDYACTTAVVSGKYTVDGRPLLWKNRETNELNNKIVEINDGKYQYVGLANSSDTLNIWVWIGYNEAGFAIMNSASYNLNNDTLMQSGEEGALMKKALQSCANIDEFEKLLKSMELPTRLEANFGVIDGQGGAAYFELGNFGYEKFDANDPKIAPNGYIIRTNYSFSGLHGQGGGYIRYVTANNVFTKAIFENNLSYKTILQKGSRNLTHSLTGEDLNKYKVLEESNVKMVPFLDYIPRSSTSSACVVQGVKAGESSSFTTMWTILGFPLTSVIIPVWITGDSILPEVVQFSDSLNNAELCNYALELKENCYTFKLGSHRYNYININALINANNTGYMQQLAGLETKITTLAENHLDNWRESSINKKELIDFYAWVDVNIRQTFYGLNSQRLN